jgi:hypothetical protein
LLTESKIHSFIEEARNLVADEDEPFRTAAFQVILNHLISNESEIVSAAESRVTIEAKEAGVNEFPKIIVPAEKINYISNLGDSDKIPILWSMADTEWMKVDDFLSGVAEAGISIAKSWSPKKGGNFNNRMFREKKLFVKKGEGKEALYKLSAEGRQRAKDLLEKYGGTAN